MRDVIIRRLTKADIRDARQWYETQRRGLGDEFLASVEESIERLSSLPESFPVVHRDLRRALVKRFPYKVFFRIVGNRIIVTCVCHNSRDPHHWQSRS